MSSAVAATAARIHNNFCKLFVYDFPIFNTILWISAEWELGYDKLLLHFTRRSFNVSEGIRNYLKIQKPLNKWVCAKLKEYLSEKVLCGKMKPSSTKNSYCWRIHKKLVSHKAETQFQNILWIFFILFIGYIFVNCLYSHCKRRARLHFIKSWLPKFSWLLQKLALPLLCYCQRIKKKL